MDGSYWRGWNQMCNIYKTIYFNVKGLLFIQLLVQTEQMGYSPTFSVWTLHFNKLDLLLYDDPFYIDITAEGKRPFINASIVWSHFYVISFFMEP